MKKLLIKDIKLPITASENEVFDAARKRIGRINGGVFSVYKKSLDMRKRDNPMFVYSVLAELENGNLPKISGVDIYEESVFEVKPKSKKRVCVVGFGPAGMFASLLLSQYGFAPVVYERGASVEERTKNVEQFMSGGILDTESNVQFGAGGAGTFSDGKLYTRINDPACGYVLKMLVKFGAPKSVLTLAKPHIGTDILRNVVKGISDEVIKNGGDIRYRTRVDSVSNKNGGVCVKTSSGDEEIFDAVILAVGHSARDTYDMLMKSGVILTPKAYSVGVRIEHLQSDINRGLYGELCEKYADILPQGEYALSDRSAGGRGAYTFCMCPGGVVVPSSSDAEEICTNGMSYSSRSGHYANSAVCVSVLPDDYGNTPTGAIEFQRNIEKTAFRKAGGDYAAPVMTIGDLLRGKRGSEPAYTPSYMNGKYTLCDFSDVFPSFVAETLKEGLLSFDRKIHGFAKDKTPLTAPETRTSSPVRITRDESMQTPYMTGVYPCGEGAGYAGGITSAAIDGMRAARAVMENA